MPLVTFSNGAAADATDVNANFALCVLTDTARTVTVSHTWSAVQKFADGAVGSPGLQFANDPDSGVYRIGANNIGVAVGGAKVLDISSSGLTVTGSITGSIAATQINSGTLPSARLSGSYTGITGVGTLTAGTWSATAIAANKGGTGQTAFTTGDLLYASGAAAISKLGIGSAGAVLTVSGGVPAWTTTLQNAGFADGWHRDNIAADTTKRACDRFGNSASTTGLVNWTAPRAGSVTGLTMELSAIPSASSITVEVFKNGSATGFTLSISSGAGSRWASTTAAKDTHTFAAGDFLQVYVVGTGTLSPTTIDLLNAGLEIEV